MKITPLDIQQQQFKGKTFGGLDADDVDAFLQAVAAEMEELLRENTELKEQVNRQSRELAELAEHEKELRDTLLAARTITEEMKANTKKEGELILAEAELKARRLVDDAERTVVELQVKAQEMRRQRLQFELELKGVLDAHARLIGNAAQS
jgi:cell division initiation protein